jgi:predicted SnoaL-like aldol condensation-catalyzing enzyme
MTGVIEHNKRQVRLFVEAVWNQGQLDLIDELVAADHLGHMPCLNEPMVGPEAVRRLVSSRRDAYPDLYIKIVDQIAEDDLVATRWRATAGTAQTSGSDRVRRWSGISLIRLLAGMQVDAYTTVAASATDLGLMKVGFSE